MATLTVSSIARASPNAKDFYRIVEILSASTVKHVRSHLRSVQIKQGRQEKSHFFLSSALEAIIAGNVW